MKTLTIHADFVCPYCFLAHQEARRSVAETGATLELAAYELRPAGTPQLSPDEPWLRAAWEQSVQPLARSLDVPITFPRLMTRTRKAHEAVAFARTHGRATELADAVYRAYWQESRDIGRIDVLVELGAGVGLDRTELKVSLDIDQWTARVEEDAARAAQLRLRGVPAYVLQDGRMRTGLQRQDELTAWMNGTDDV